MRVTDHHSTQAPPRAALAEQLTQLLADWGADSADSLREPVAALLAQFDDDALARLGERAVTTGAETTVFMPAGLTWSSGSCGGPPVGDELVWSIGNLGNGASTQCSFISMIDAGTPFDLEFGAVGDNTVVDHVRDHSAPQGHELIIARDKIGLA